MNSLEGGAPSRMRISITFGNQDFANIPYTYIYIYICIHIYNVYTHISIYDIGVLVPGAMGQSATWNTPQR